MEGAARRGRGHRGGSEMTENKSYYRELIYLILALALLFVCGVWWELYSSRW